MTVLSRRQASLAIFSAILISGCDTDQKPGSAATFFNNSGVQDAMKKLAGAIDSMDGEVGRFQSDDWQEIVPDVESASADVAYAFRELQQSLGISAS